jgi:hypothetical protein
LNAKQQQPSRASNTYKWVFMKKNYMVGQIYSLPAANKLLSRAAVGSRRKPTAARWPSVGGR